MIHHSEDGSLLYRLAPKIDRTKPGGYNELEVSRRERGHVADPDNAMPRDETFSRQFERQNMPNRPLPVSMDPEKGAPSISPDSSTGDMFNALCIAAVNRDDAASRGISQAYGQSDAGQAFLGMGQAINQQMELKQNQFALQAQLQAIAQAQQAQGPGLGR